MESFFRIIDGDIGDALRSTRIKKLHTYWRELAQDGVPLRADIDPARIKPLLPYLMIVDLTDEPLRIRYRLAGTEVVRYTGLELTGLYLDEIKMDDFNVHELLQAYRAIRDTGQCGIGAAEFGMEGARALTTEYLMCPLRTNATKIDKCVVIEDYFFSNGAHVEDLPAAQLRRTSKPTD
jgi:hypothetical protein